MGPGENEWDPLKGEADDCTLTLTLKQSSPWEVAPGGLKPNPTPGEQLQLMKQT